MSSSLAALAPAAIWQHFDTLCAIPRPSGHEEKVAAHIRALARSWGLETHIDAPGNVIVKKRATPGMEQRRTVVLQCHLDMVPQRAHDSTHNFETDPILPIVDGAVVRAKGTTLGADNGIGVAATLALLASKDIPHGPLEALFTTDEEAGMTGANTPRLWPARGPPAAA